LLSKEKEKKKKELFVLAVCMYAIVVRTWPPVVLASAGAKSGGM
jgi:hypothetical protein